MMDVTICILLVYHLCIAVTGDLFEEIQNTKLVKVVESFHASSKISCALKCNKKKHDNYRYESTLCKCYVEDDTSDLHQIQMYTRKEMNNPCFEYPCSIGTVCRSTNKLQPSGYECLCPTTSPWKIQVSNIKYGSTGNSFALFTVLQSGLISQINITHKAGGSKCSGGGKFYKFGCRYTRLTPVIADVNKKVYAPKDYAKISNIFGTYELQGYNADSNVIIFNNLLIHVIKNTNLFIYHAEDFLSSSFSDNQGETTVDIAFKFCQY